MDKVASMENIFKEAYDFLHGTGVGFDNEDSLNAETVKRCPYFLS